MLDSIHISFSNLFIGDFNAIYFSLVGIAIVFSGLTIISLYIRILPILLNWINQLGHKKAPLETTSSGLKDRDDDGKELFIAIATAIHLEMSQSEVNQKLTWLSYETHKDPWHLTGLNVGLSKRSFQRRRQ